MAKIVEIIKDDENTKKSLIWKYPVEDFNTGTQLIVHEAQEAIFFMNGQALDLFGPGRYTLETQNMPLLSRFFNKATDGKTPYHCEIYFIDKTEQMAMKWGTDSQVQYMEPKYKFPLQIGASGELTFQVENSRKLLEKVVGIEKNFSDADLLIKLRAFLMGRIKPYIAETMQKTSFSIFEVDSHMAELSSQIQTILEGDFEEYGLSLKHFFVTTIAKPEGDVAYEKFKELHIRQYTDITEANLQQQVEIIQQETEAKRKVIEAESLAKKREIEGYDYRQERSFDVTEKAAQNEGTGDFSNLGIGLRHDGRRC